eukprot:c8023_g2_i1.p1 GENE.c8023_g2_i1~~c8023_g2_i1.p1  ORF type:complete len:289 (-),score=62.54 c8023_g2_i1:85-951(-)
MPVFPERTAMFTSALELFPAGEALVFETRLINPPSQDGKAHSGNHSGLPDANFSHSPNAESFPLIIAFFNDDMQSDTSPCQLVCVEFGVPPPPASNNNAAANEPPSHSIIDIIANETRGDTGQSSRTGVEENQYHDTDSAGVQTNSQSSVSEGSPDGSMSTDRASARAMWANHDSPLQPPEATIEMTSISNDSSVDPSLPPWFATATVLKMLAATNEHVYDIQEVFGSRENAEESDCVVCLTVPMNTILLPCRHLCVCDACFRMIDKCPICRADFTGFLKYLPDKELI